MRFISQLFWSGVMASVGVLVTAGAGRASFISGSGSLGSFTGSFTYTPADAAHASLVIDLTNTSPPANGGYLTAFAFNNPGNHITGATLSSSNSHFSLLGGPSFNNTINAGPNGYFDIGASTGGSYEGTGPPSLGIGIGLQATFTFALTGTQLDALTQHSFFSEFSAPPADGGGDKFFVARFRGFNNGGSDKVPVTVTHAPEPGTLTLCGTGLLGLLGYRRLRRRTDKVTG